MVEYGRSMLFFKKLKHPQKIPKILHFVWVGGKPLPEKTCSYLKSWSEHNPDYLIVRWDENNIDFSHHYLRNAYKYKKWANISNLVRLLAVYKFGGIYLDTDIKVLRSLDPLLANDCFFGFQLKELCDCCVNNAVFGAQKQHWFVKKISEKLLADFDGTEESHLSSPVLTTQLLLSEGLKSYSDKGVKIKDITIYSVETFNPFSWKEKFHPSQITPDTYTLHFWERSWWEKKHFDELRLAPEPKNGHLRHKRK